MRQFVFLAVAAALSFAGPAAAAVIYDLPDADAREMPASNSWGGGPVRFDGVTYTGRHPTNGGSNTYFGLTHPFSFGNTVWSGTPAVAVGYDSAVMSFAFDAPVSAVLAELAWSRIPGGGPLTLSIFNSGGAMLESLSFAPDDPAVQTGFFGFRRSNADIARFEVAGYYFGARNLSTFTEAVSAVPEPATWAMMIIGFAGTGAMVRKARRQALAVA